MLVHSQSVTRNAACQAMDVPRLPPEARCPVNGPAIHFRSGWWRFGSDRTSRALTTSGKVGPMRLRFVDSRENSRVKEIINMVLVVDVVRVREYSRTKPRCHRGCLTDHDLLFIITACADASQQTCSQWIPYVQEGGHLHNVCCSLAAGAQSPADTQSATTFKSHRHSYIPASPSTSSALPPTNYVCPF